MQTFKASCFPWLFVHHIHNGAQQQPLKIPVAPSLSPGTLRCPTRPHRDGGQLRLIPHSPVTLCSSTSPSSSLNIFVEMKSRPLEYLERVLQVEEPGAEQQQKPQDKP